MHTSGRFSVNAQGAATYYVPLALPPSTGGVGPDLGLAYTSSAGSGLLGQGWLLSGIPAIERCAATTARDGGVQGAVRFDRSDRFCLDGSRLMVVNDKEYGQDGAEYRTEIDSFLKIVSYGVSGDGPSSFKVWTKAGRVLEFGNSTSSHIEAQGGNTVRVWALNRSADIKGNYYDVFYIKNADTGEYYPDHIDYSGNSVNGGAPYNSVKFSYTPRPNIDMAYRRGSIIQSTVRMSGIKAYAGQDLVSEYRIGYREEIPWEPSRLGSLQRCDAYGSCLPATDLGYTARPSVRLQPGVWQTTGRSGIDSLNYPKFVPLDINGDGKTDLVQPSNRDNILWLTPMISNGNGFDIGEPMNTGEVFGQVLAGDFNGDGKGDLMIYPINASPPYEWPRKYDLKFIPLLSNGTTFTIGPLTVIPPNCVKGEGPELKAMDVDGDGRTDIVQICNDHGDLWLQTLISNGGTLDAQSNMLISRRSEGYPEIKLMPGDFDGDGKQDLIAVWQEHWYTRVYALPLLSAGKSFTAGQWIDTGLYLNDFETPFDYVYVMDVNGDATQDLLFVKIAEFDRSLSVTPFFSDGVSLIRGMATGLNPVGSYPTYEKYGRPGFGRVVPADINGDGKMDLIQEMGYGTEPGWIVPQGLLIQPFISTGATFKHLDWYETGQPYDTVKIWAQDQEGIYYRQGAGPGLIYLDFNGDGQTDMIQVKELDNIPLIAPYTLAVLPYQSIGGRGSLMNLVDNGLGSITRWTYKPLTDNTVYTRDSGANTASYPLADLQTPLFVVDKVLTPNGNGGVQTTTYQYGGMKVDMNRRAWTGFRWIESTDNDTGIVHRSWYRQDWPLWGALSVQQTRLAGKGNNGLLQETNLSYYCTDFVSSTGCASAPGRRYLVAPNRVTNESWDLNGAAFPATVGEMEYDAWGNLTMRKTTRDGYVTTVRTWFDNDADKWFIGRPSRIEETRTTP